MSSNALRAAAREHSKPDFLLRTRRSVMETANLMRTKRARQRRHAGLALLAMAAVLVFFAPALWSTAMDLSTGEHFLDMPVVVLILSLIFLSTILAALLMSWKDRRRRMREE
jgi:cytochrome bd-type quinol oxidase subunit 2